MHNDKYPNLKLFREKWYNNYLCSRLYKSYLEKGFLEKLSGQNFFPVQYSVILKSQLLSVFFWKHQIGLISIKTFNGF